MCWEVFDGSCFGSFQTASSSVFLRKSFLCQCQPCGWDGERCRGMTWRIQLHQNESNTCQVLWYFALLTSTCDIDGTDPQHPNLLNPATGVTRVPLKIALHNSFNAATDTLGGLKGTRDMAPGITFWMLRDSHKPLSMQKRNEDSALVATCHWLF